MPGELRVYLVEHTRIRYGLSQVRDTAYPGNQTLDAHAEARVGNGTVLAQLNVPLEGFPREVVLFDALLDERQVMDTLRAAADLAVAFRGYQVGGEYDFGPVGVGLHVKRL